MILMLTSPPPPLLEDVEDLVMLMLPPPPPPLEDMEDLVMLMLPPPVPPSISKVVTFLVEVISISISSWINNFITKSTMKQTFTLLNFTC